MASSRLHDKELEMKAFECSALQGKFYHSAAITDDGKTVVLCGRNIRMFDLQEQCYSQTIARSSNALVAISHDQKTVCTVSASAKNITIIEFACEEQKFIEKTRFVLKGDYNTDGGKPCFSGDNQYLYFATWSKKLWRYTRESGKCECIYQVEHADQYFFFDLFNDQILITLNSSAMVSHKGFDILSLDGSCLKSLRYGENDQRIRGMILGAKWLNKDEILVLYPLGPQESFDALQIIPWRKSEELHLDLTEIVVERGQQLLWGFHISPERRFIAMVLRRLDSSLIVQFYTTQGLKKIFEVPVDDDDYLDLTFSQNERYGFISAQSCLAFEME